MSISIRSILDDLHKFIIANDPHILIRELSKFPKNETYNTIKYLIQCGRIDTIDVISTTFNIDINFDNGILAINAAMNYTTIKYLLDHNVDVAVYNNFLIRRCCENKNSLELLRLIIDSNANIRIFEDYPLRQSAAIGNFEYVRFLLELNADAQADQSSALTKAVVGNYESIIKLLLNYQADIHCNNEYPLIQSVKYSNKSMVKYLLDANANIHADNDKALFLAFQSKNIKMVTLLLTYGANCQALTNHIHMTGNKFVINKLVKILEENGMSIDQIVSLLSNE